MFTLRSISASVACAAAIASAPAAALEPLSGFKQTVAQEAGSDPALSDFYRLNDYEAIWTDDAADDRSRVEALMTVLDRAGDHALPRGLYGADAVRDLLESIATQSNRAAAEVALSRLYLSYAEDVGTGILDPRSVDAGIKRTAPELDGAELLTKLRDDAPRAVLRSLAPQTQEYARLMRKRLELLDVMTRGGWGPSVAGIRLDPGDQHPSVLDLGRRLTAMGYLRSQPSDVYDEALVDAVRRFQADHGLVVDGIVGPQTLSELNVSPEERVGQITVAMERERWTNMELGDRHVWVNIPDFTVALIDDGRVTFRTRSVVGASNPDRRTPEFSDKMEHLVVNPTWHVPRSIAVDEYLPQFQRDKWSNSHLVIYYKGQPISRERINFLAATPQNWPFELKQPPSRSNALGRVKFMLPNRWNIYLHDTPAKSLFNRTSRGYSHGCVRLGDPYEFAYRLLERQTDDPKTFFSARLGTGRETVVELEENVPVHIVYRTAFTTPKGDIQFRPDIYGRDARVLDALHEAGVEIASGAS